MRYKKWLTLIHWSWLIAALALGLTIYYQLFFGYKIWEDLIVIISSLLIIAYWIPIAQNWKGLTDSIIKQRQDKTNKDLDTIEDNRLRKKLRLVGFLISISLLMIVISRIIKCISANSA